MNNDNQHVIFCEDGEYRIFCDICDEIYIERYYKTHLKSKTHPNIIRNREKLKISFQIISLI